MQQVPKSSSGANPNNRNRHRQAGGEGADDRQGECEKRIYVRAQIVYRHSLTPLRAHKSKSRTGTKFYGTLHVLSKDEAKFLFEKGCDQVVIGSGQMATCTYHRMLKPTSKERAATSC
jgi:hypothetical protein